MVIAVAEATDAKFKSHPNHTPLKEAYRDPNVTDMIFLAKQIATVHMNDKGRKQFTLERIMIAFNAHGHGDIGRLRDDLEDFFNKKGISLFLRDILYYLLRERQGACARCGRKISNHTHGAWGFQCDHVAENFRKPGEASTKTGSVSDIEELMKKLLEMAQTQLTCGKCHDNLTYKKTEEIRKMIIWYDEENDG